MTFNHDITPCSSQEEELGLELNLVADEVSDRVRVHVFEGGKLTSLLGVADSGEQVGDLVRVHAWRRHLDSTSPVEVVVAQSEDKLLQLELGQVGLVHRHVEVSWLLAALGATHWEQEEVKLVSIITRRLNQLGVDEAAARRIAQPALSVLDKEGLDDPLVDDNEGDLWLSGGLVVGGLAGLLELGNFLADDLGTLTLGNAVAEDDDVCGVAVLVGLSERVKTLLEALLELSIDHFLTLLLYDEVRVVL